MPLCNRQRQIRNRGPDGELTSPLIHHAQKLSWIFRKTEDKLYGFARLAKWSEQVEQSGFKSFNTVARTINLHHKNILNYFDNKSTNASAESFNAKIKAFRAQYRGVGNISFFLFRLTKLFA